mgnify:FL=1
MRWEKVEELPWCDCNCEHPGHPTLVFRVWGAYICNGCLDGIGEGEGSWRDERKDITMHDGCTSKEIHLRK